MQGERLGPYRIDRELGAGGMGKVYAATVAERAPGLAVGDRVALKVVHPHLLETSGFFMRFMREAQIGASIQHENVVRTYMADALAAGGVQHNFLVMEYVEGQTLRDLLAELDKVPEELCRHIGREIAKGLGAIHAAGVVHRDLKPENVLITPDHVVKVMDLGVAQLTEESIRLSHSGAFVGSAEYAAPEQFGGAVDHRCDLHALGLLLYELSCGQHPYRADDFRTVMKHVCEDAPRRLGDINPQLSAFFEEVVHTLLAKRVDERFESATALLAVLEEGEESEWWHERARSLQTTTQRPLRRIRIPRETAVYGRDKELDTLRGLYDRAKAGEGQVLLVEGEAGIGKSRLVDELIVRLQADGEELNFLFGSYPPGGAATAAGGFSSAFREHFGDAGSAAYLQQTPVLVPAFDALLRGEPSPTGVVELTRDSLGTCFVHATRALAAERPTVVLIDDLHFAPEEARTLFTALAQAVPGHRVLLIGTMRPGVSEEWVANVTRLDQASRLEVQRLGPKDLASLLSDCFKSQELAVHLAGQIGIKSDGNPFFAFEIIRGLREGQFITQKEDGTWASTRVIDEIQIPSSVLDLVNARVADLTDDERNLLDVAACWGYEFDASLVGEALGMRRLPVLQTMAKIEKRDRLVRSVGRRFVFDHHQVQEALYGALPEMLREEYHAALAEALETRTKAADAAPSELDGALCVDLCEHYLKGARGDAALRYLPTAQAHLRKGYLNAHVIELSERALAVPDLLEGRERAEVLLQLTDALHRVGRRAREEACVGEAVQLGEALGDDALRAQAMNKLGAFLFRVSRFDEAETAYLRALEIARASGDDVAEAKIIGNLGNIYHVQGRLAEAREHFERALAHACARQGRDGADSATGNLGVVCAAEGQLDQAQKLFERQLELSRERQSRDGEATATGNLGVLLWEQRRIPEARDHIQRHLELSRAIGDRHGECRALGNLSILFHFHDRALDAERCAERMLELSREIADRQLEATARSHMGSILLAEGRSSEARDHYERALALSREVGDGRSEPMRRHNIAVALGAEGASQACIEQFRESLTLSRQIGIRRMDAHTCLLLGSRLALEGDTEAAREQLATAYDLAKETGLHGNEVLSLCELAALPGGDAGDAVISLDQHGARLSGEEHREARLLLWKATGDRSHLADAKRSLDAAIALAPEEHHESMCTNVRVNREILEAWRGESGKDGGTDGPGGTESVTRVG